MIWVHDPTLNIYPTIIIIIIIIIRLNCWLHFNILGKTYIYSFKVYIYRERAVILKWHIGIDE